jgi:hypothetical protein
MQTNNILFRTIYLLTILVHLFLSVVLYAILLDEGVKFKNLAKAYVLGVEFNYYSYNIFTITLLILTIIIILAGIVLTVKNRVFSNKD